jgi:hypothetical protein
MPITPNTGSLFHAETQASASKAKPSKYNGSALAAA